MDDTLISRTYVLTFKQACKDAIESQRVAQTSTVSISTHKAEKGKGMHEATGIMVMPPKWLCPNKALWVSGVIAQPQTR